MNTKSIPWYNTKEGIAAKLDTLENFHKLLDERRIAHQERKENLNGYFILNGHYHLDSMGQCWKLSGEILTVDVPLVISQEDNLASFSGGGGYPPTPYILCPECGNGWDMSNVIDNITTKAIYKPFSAKEYIGKSLTTMWEAYEKKTDAEYEHSTSHCVKNKKYIDDTPDPERDGLSINSNGFIPDDYGATDPEYILQEGDEVYFWVNHCYHRQCLKTFIEKLEALLKQ